MHLFFFVLVLKIRPFQSGDSAHNVSTIEPYHLLQTQFCVPLRQALCHSPSCPWHLS